MILKPSAVGWGWKGRKVERRKEKEVQRESRNGKEKRRKR